MADYLMRDDAPLTDAEWEKLDEVVVSVARQLLVGRRFIELSGPFGIGAEIVRLDLVKVESEVAQVSDRRYIPLPLIHKDFVLSWRDVEAARQSGHGLELGPAAAAAAAVARAEDALVFQGLLGAKDAQSVELGDWDTGGGALTAVSSASAVLAEAGFVGPYTLVVSPDLYAKLQRPFKGSGRLESRLVKSIADGGILQAPPLGTGKALMIARGRYYVDLAVGQDMVIAYLGPEAMDHRFRVLETVALRVKQPGAICIFA